MKRMAFVLLGMLLLVGCGNRQEAAAPGSSAGSQTQTTRQSSVGEGDVEQGLKYLKEGKAVEAVKSFDQAIRDNPLDTRPYLILAQTYMHMKAYTQAIDTLQAASRVAPNEGSIYYLLAINYGLTGQLETARDQAKKAVEAFQAQKDEKNFSRSVALYQSLSKAVEDKNAKGTPAGQKAQNIGTSAATTAP